MRWIVRRLRLARTTIDPPRPADSPIVPSGYIGCYSNAELFPEDEPAPARVPRSKRANARSG